MVVACPSMSDFHFLSCPGAHIHLMVDGKWVHNNFSLFTTGPTGRRYKPTSIEVDFHYTCESNKKKKKIYKRKEWSGMKHDNGIKYYIFFPTSGSLSKKKLF